MLQWDKDDCAAAGLVKFDLLGLGMLTMHLAVDPVREHEGIDVDLATIPQEARRLTCCARPTPSACSRSSRAQMATLPRLRPRSTTSSSRSRSSAPARSRVARCTRTCAAATARSPSYLARCSRNVSRRRSACRCSRWLMQMAIDIAGFSPGESTGCAKPWARSAPTPAWPSCASGCSPAWPSAASPGRPRRRSRRSSRRSPTSGSPRATR